MKRCLAALVPECSTEACRYLGQDRQQNRERGALVGRGHHVDAAAMGGHDLPRDEQAQPEAGRGLGSVLGFQSNQGVEDRWQEFRRDRLALIGNAGDGYVKRNRRCARYLRQLASDRGDGFRDSSELGAATEDSQAYESLLAKQSDEPIEVRRRSSDTAVILSSGGTTGQPKGVVLSERSWQTMIFGMSDIFRTERPVMLIVAPMTHASGVLALGMMHMGTMNVVLPAFDPVAVMQAIEKHRVTHVFLPPTAIYVMLSHPEVRRTTTALSVTSSPRRRRYQSIAWPRR